MPYTTDTPWWRRPAVITAVIVVLVGVAVGVLLTRSGSSNATSAPPGNICPLTGEPPPSGTVPARPALAVKVDNYPTARPQSGLDRADIVYEEPVEGGVTRYVAVFQCQDAPLVGPIRSARYPDVAILKQLSHPVFVHAGGIDPILAMVRNANAYDYDLLVRPGIVQRPAGRVPPYDTYVSTAGAWRTASHDTSRPSPVFTYSPSVPAATSVASVHIPFSPTSNETWNWSAADQRWLLSYSGAPATLTGGSPISAANVVILHVRTRTGPWLENNLGDHEVEVDPTSGGPAQVLRDGVLVTGTWSRSHVSSPTRLVGANGADIPLQPGPTWVALVPSQIPVTPSH